MLHFHQLGYFFFITLINFHHINKFLWNLSIIIKGINFHHSDKFPSHLWSFITFFFIPMINFHYIHEFSSNWSTFIPLLHFLQSNEFSSNRWIFSTMMNFHLDLWIDSYNWQWELRYHSSLSLIWKISFILTGKLPSDMIVISLMFLTATGMKTRMLWTKLFFLKAS